MTHRFAVPLALLLALPAVAAAGFLERSANPIAGRYVVVLDDHLATRATAPGLSAPTAAEVVGEMAARYGIQVGRRYEHALTGFVARMSEAQALALAADPRVDRVVEDGWVELAWTQNQPPSWGLDRVDQRSADLDSTYSYPTPASGIHVYVIDTGIRSTHIDFEGRVDTANGFTAVADGNGSEDCHGHGTHVAGVIGGATYGGAKEVLLHPVRVADCSGNGAISDVAAGIDWVTSNFKQHQRGPASQRWKAVANVSLSSVGTWLIDVAVRNSTLAGVTYVVAAGNNGGDACAYSPARVSEAITVGATNSLDEVASFSNRGSCVDLYAPGTSITSAFIRDDYDSLAMTGTSAAAPHVTAAAALYLASYPDTTPANLKQILVATSTAGVSPTDRYLYSSILDDGWDDPAVPLFSFTCDNRRTCIFDPGASIDDFGIAAYAWEFGDGGSSTKMKPRHRFDTSAASFTVTLSLTDSSGQTSSFSKEVNF